MYHAILTLIRIFLEGWGGKSWKNPPLELIYTVYQNKGFYTNCKNLVAIPRDNRNGMGGGGGGELSFYLGGKIRN